MASISVSGLLNFLFFSLLRKKVGERNRVAETSTTGGETEAPLDVRQSSLFHKRFLS